MRKPKPKATTRCCCTTVVLLRSTEGRSFRSWSDWLDSTAHSSGRAAALARLRDTALAGGNLFEVLMGAVRCCSLGEITHTLFDVGGRYRRNV